MYRSRYSHAELIGSAEPAINTHNTVAATGTHTLPLLFCCIIVAGKEMHNESPSKSACFWWEKPQNRLSVGHTEPQRA
jgi:hypothetical protein